MKKYPEGSLSMREKGELPHGTLVYAPSHLNHCLLTLEVPVEDRIFHKKYHWFTNYWLCYGYVLRREKECSDGNIWNDAVHP